jgi:hypothetical protein
MAKKKEAPKAQQQTAVEVRGSGSGAVGAPQFDWSKVLQFAQFLLTVLQQMFPPQPAVRAAAGHHDDEEGCDEHALLDHAICSAVCTLTSLLEIHKGRRKASGVQPDAFGEGETCLTFSVGGGAVLAKVCAGSKEEAKAALEKIVGRMSELSPEFGLVVISSGVSGVELSLRLTKEQIADDANWTGG